MNSWRGIGLMSGTSLDGVDLAYCEFRLEDGQWSFDLLIGETSPMEEKWQARLAYLDQTDARTFSRTHVYWGRFLGMLVRDFVSKHKISPQFVSSHGQTIFHEPNKNYTTQIGDGETMAAFLDCPLVTNLRNKDVALGGQGAPLVPFGEYHLWPGIRWFLNLGGIANLSRIDGPEDSLAFDVTVSNMALNWLARQYQPHLTYDAGGQIAASGTIHQELLEALNKLDYFQRPAPKSLGAEWFGDQILPLLRNEEIPAEDRMHTVSKHLSFQLHRELERLGARNEKLLVTGGGAHNTFLMNNLREQVASLGIEIPTLTHDIIDFKEAIIFAFLGLCVLRGKSNIMHNVTGASRAVPGGSIHLPPSGGYAIL